MDDRQTLLAWLAFSVLIALLRLPWPLTATLVALGGFVLWRRRGARSSVPADEHRPPAFFGDPLSAPSSTLFLGDVFSEVAPDGLLAWDAQPTAGRTVHLLLACDGTVAPRTASASWVPFTAGPFSVGRAADATLRTIAIEGDTPHRSIELVLPDTPGWYWLHLRVDDHVFGPLRLEVADPSLREARAAAFAAADAALAASGDEGPWLVSGLYAPRPAEELRRVLGEGVEFAGTGGSAWPLIATRVDDEGVLQPQPGKPLNRLVLVDPATGRATLHDDFALATWTTYQWPQRAPRGGYAGWWWKREGLPAGGLCGTAWCHYPFRGNLPRAWAPTMAIAVPPPPDPLDWWLGRRRGWICGNGWWQGRQGPGGMRFGPWWPLDAQGQSAPHEGPSGPGDPPPPPPPPAPPGQTRTRRKPPGLQPPPEAAACAADFVEAVSKYEYGRPPYGRRVRPGDGVHGVARYDRLPSYTGAVRWVRMVDGWSRAGGYTRAWSEEQVNSELQRVRAWWAQYCIAVTDRELVLPDSAPLRALAGDYRRWLDDLPTPPPGVMMGLGDDMTARGLGLLDRSIAVAQAAVRRDPGGTLLVLFMPRVLGRTGHTAANESRATEASFTVPGEPIVVLNRLDADDPYILAHELIHAWGRPPGAICWDHQSGHPRAMSRIVRQHIKQAAGLGAERLLDYAEYDEILSAGTLTPVSR